MLTLPFLTFKWPVSGIWGVCQCALTSKVHLSFACGDCASSLCYSAFCPLISMKKFLIPLVVLLVCTLIVTGCANGESKRGYRYLEDNLNSSLNLIRESPDDANFTLHKTYWLLNDNFLASYALKPYDPGLSTKLMSTIEKYGYQHDHYIEILFGNSTIEPNHKVEPEPKVVEKKDDVYYIKTEKVTDTVMDDYAQYLDKLCYEALWNAYGGNVSETDTLYNEALNMWDGKGFNDNVFKAHPENGYDTYKLAVFYYTAKALGKLDTLEFKDTLLSTISGLQASNGGFYTYYYYDDNEKLQPRGSTNTETTSLILIALNYKPKPLSP